jgi:DCN1-like protein 1/2
MFGRGSKNSLEASFDSFYAADASRGDPNSLGPVHLLELASALGVSGDDIVMYIIVWKLRCQTPQTVKKEEWLKGLAAMKIESIEKLKAALPTFRNEITSANNFRDFYAFLFDWIRDSPSLKVITSETAVALWTMLFSPPSPRTFPLRDKWLEFMSTVHKKAVSKDLWKQTLEFSAITLDKYDPESSWPTAMDEFVEWVKK